MNALSTASLDGFDLRVRVAIADQLRAMRIREGVSQADLASRIGHHRAIVCRVERAVHTARLDTIALHAHGVGGSLREVLCVVDRHLGFKPARRAKRPSARNRSTP